MTAIALKLFACGLNVQSISNLSQLVFSFLFFSPGSVLSKFNLIFLLGGWEFWPEEQGEEPGDELGEKIDHRRRWPCQMVARGRVRMRARASEGGREREKAEWEREQGLGRAGSLKGRGGLGGVLKAAGVLAQKNAPGFYLGNLIVSLCTWEMEGIRVAQRLYSHGPHKGSTGFT